MKALVVAFDFSKNALNTLEYAIMYARQTGAELHLVWVDNENTPDPMMNIEQSLRIETKKYFDKIVENYEPKLGKGRFHVHLRKGKVYTEIAMAARQVEADLVFAGTHGISGYERLWIGSNAYRIVTSSPSPVITIKSDFDHTKGIQKILLPLDSSAESRLKLPLTARLAEAFNAEIHILLLYNSPLKTIKNRMLAQAEEAVRCLTDRSIPNIVKEIEADNMAKSILQYASESEADLLSIMTEQANTSGNMFLGPYAQQLINNALIPVLSIQSSNVEKEW